MAAVADREQTSDAVHRGTEVVAIAFVSRSGVNRRSHLQPADRRKVLRRRRALRGEDCRHRIFRAGERGAERIAEGLEDITSVLADRRAKQAIVTSHGLAHGSTVALPTRRAPFDVGEQKRHRTRRQRTARHPTHRIRQWAHRAPFGRLAPATAAP